MSFFHNSCRFERTLDVLSRLGGLSEAAQERALAFWRRLEESLARLGGGLKPRVDLRTILRRLGSGLEASCGVLKAS